MMSSRTSIACERCRRLRKRCQPPYPCPACQAAGTACQVRTKARPLRSSGNTAVRQARTREPRQAAADLSRSILDVPAPEDGALPQIGDGISMPPSSQRDALCDFPGQGECPRGLLRYREALNGIKKTVFSHAEEFFGYQLECDLTEPGLALWEVQQSATMQQRDLQSIGQCILTEHDIIRWIASFKQHLAIQSTIVRDEDQLFMLADLIRKSMIQQSGDELAPMLNRLGVSMDCASLLLGILSLGALCSGDYPKGHIFFEESRRLLDDYAGEPTFDLCLAVHLHHIYILMTGTSNRARAVACFNVQIAHDLGLDQKQDAPENISGLRLYLLIMMSDQYSAQTHGTKPVISASSLKDDLFDPLVQVEPEVLPLLQLMKANSLSLEALVEKDFARDNVVDLEAKIDRASISTQRFDPSNCSPTSFGKLYWPVARLHMFWYRLLLRSPFLSEEVGWLTSLSICLHAAEMILSSYFEMAYPALKAGPLQGIVSHSGALPWELHGVVLPPTWRQVQRIMTASFIVFLSYWKGELTKLETTRYTSMAMLLLVHQSMRWGRALDQCTGTLERLANLCALDLSRGKASLLQDDSAQIPGTSMFPEVGTTDSSFYGSGEQVDLGTVTGERADTMATGGLFDDLVLRTWVDDFMV